MPRDSAIQLRFRCTRAMMPHVRFASSVDLRLWQRLLPLCNDRRALLIKVKICRRWPCSLGFCRTLHWYRVCVPTAPPPIDPRYDQRDAAQLVDRLQGKQRWRCLAACLGSAVQAAIPQRRGRTGSDSWDWQSFFSGLGGRRNDGSCFQDVVVYELRLLVGDRV